MPIYRSCLTGSMHCVMSGTGSARSGALGENLRFPPIMAVTKKVPGETFSATTTNISLLTPSEVNSDGVFCFLAERFRLAQKLKVSGFKVTKMVSRYRLRNSFPKESKN